MNIISGIFINLVVTLIIFAAWVIVSPLIMLFLIAMFFLFFVAVIWTVSGRNKKAWTDYKRLWLLLFPIRIKTTVETTQMPDLIEVRQHELDAGNGNFDNNIGAQFYAEVIRLDATGNPELHPGPEGGFVLRNLRVYPTSEMFFGQKRITWFNMRGIRNALRRRHYLVKNVYYRIGQGPFVPMMKN